MANLQPLLPNQPPRTIQQSIFPPIAPTADLSSMTPAPNPLGTIASIAPPPLASVGLDPRAAAAEKASDDLVSRANAYSEDLYKRSHPVAPTTTLGKIGHVAANIGNVLGDIFAPGPMSLIPGTQLHNETEKNRDLAGLQDVSKLQNEAAQRERDDAQALYDQQHAGAVGLRPITPEEANAIGNPELAGTMAASPSIAHMLTTAANNKTRETVATTNAAGKVSAAQIAADAKKNIAALKPEQRDDRAIRILATPEAERTPDDVAYLRGYNQWVEQTKVEPGVARAQAYAQWKPVQVVDPTTGNTYYASAAAAINSHAPGTSSIPFRTAAAMAHYMTSGKGGATMTAYRTATDHLDLLGKAAEALQNGDIPAFNRVGNTLAQETGQAAPTNFNAVKSMLSGELANVAKASGATDQEIAEERAQINRASSPEQIAGIIKINQELMDQKAQEMFEQFQAGMQGQPVTTRGGINPSSRTPLTPHGGNGAPVTPPNKGVFDVAKWAKANPNGDVNAAKAYAKSQGYEVK